MSFGTWAETRQTVVVVVDELARRGEAVYQLVVEAESVRTVIYLGVGDDLEFWRGEVVRLFGVWPAVWGRGNFVIVNGE